MSERSVAIMAKKNRVCLTCNEKYSYCPNCNRKDPAWMVEFHSENCKNIFDIATRFNMQLLTKEEAKAAMEQCDLTNKEKFKSYVQQDLENIFAVEESPVKKHTKKTPVVEAEPVHEVVEE